MVATFASSIIESLLKKGDIGMDMEDMAKELDRLQELLKETDPLSNDYAVILNRYEQLMKVFHSEQEACDADLDHRTMRELNGNKQAMSEYEIRSKVKIAKMEAVFGLAKTVLTISGTLAAIILTGSLEETTILSNKCLAWIKSITPKI